MSLDREHVKDLEDSDGVHRTCCASDSNNDALGAGGRKDVVLRTPRRADGRGGAVCS